METCGQVLAEIKLLSRRWKLGDLLRAIGGAIHGVETEVSQQGHGLPPELQEAMAGIGREPIEDYIGLAFVACQVQINAVCRAVEELHRLAQENGRNLRTTNGRRCSIMEYASTEKNRPSEVRAIHAFANYYKHRSEWPPGWVGLNRQQAFSADVIRVYGATPDGSSNLTNGLVAMGYRSLVNLSGMDAALFEWNDALTKYYDHELRSLGLL
jgi:hypothetical protein